LAVKRRTLTLVLLLGVIGLGAVSLYACNRYADDIDAVKQAQSIVPGQTNEVLAINIAGARSSIDWQAGPAPKYDNPEIIGVTAVIKRTSGNGNKHQVDLMFIHNRQTKKVAFDGALVDGKPQNLVSGAMSLFLMQLE
jgi:hypothetical protein